MSLLSWGEKHWGQDFSKIRPTTITKSEFDNVFYKVWTKQEDKFLAQFQEKLIKKQVVGNIQEFFESCSEKFGYQHPVFIENIV